jgi:integrase
MSLYKRGNVWWTAVWVDSVRTLRSLDTANRREAERRAQAIADQLRTKRFQSPELQPEMTFGELYTRFLAEGDVKRHHLDRAKHFLGFFDNLPIGRITRNDAIRYRKVRLETQHGSKLPSDATINRDLSVVRHILYWALDEGYLTHNPFTRIRMARERRKRRPVLPVAAEVKLLRTSAPHLIPIIVLALDTGMRRGELLNQKWEDVDFDRKAVFVTHSKTPEGEMREIPLTGRSFELLSRLRKARGRIFLYKGEPLINLKTGWAAAIRRSGIGHYRFHDLRHSFNSRLLEAGIIADVRKALMGHSDGSDVHAGYSHVEIHSLRDAIRRLEAWHSAKLSTLATETDGHSLPASTNQPTEDPTYGEVPTPNPAAQ